MKTRPDYFAQKNFGTMPDGRPVTVFYLQNRQGLRVGVSDLGATLVSAELPDRNGVVQDVLHGFSSAEGYLGKENPYFGATVGRFGNRIGAGEFSLAGKNYSLATNNSPGGQPCHLHGGREGFSHKLWAVESFVEGQEITFSLVSPDGEEGYPGKVSARLTYRLDDESNLWWEARAEADAPTIINMIHHPYWNLSGNPETSILDHVLTIPAESFLPTNPGLIPTGEFADVAGTPMDFRVAKEVGASIDQDYEPLKLAGGYDHCWVLSRAADGQMRTAARVTCPRSGRSMEISTNQPGVQFYSGNFLDGQVTGKNGLAYQQRTALCLETENFPDAPNHPGFPSCELRPGQNYHHVMVYRFRVNS
jgi:aldose 1-epimerase